MHFAAAMHDLRNRYAGFLSVIKAGLLTGPQIKEERYSLEREDDFAGYEQQGREKGEYCFVNKTRLDNNRHRDIPTGVG